MEIQDIISRLKAGAVIQITHLVNSRSVPVMYPVEVTDGRLWIDQTPDTAVTLTDTQVVCMIADGIIVASTRFTATNRTKYFDLARADAGEASPERWSAITKILPIKDTSPERWSVFFPPVKPISAGGLWSGIFAPIEIEPTGYTTSAEPQKCADCGGKGTFYLIGSGESVVLSMVPGESAVMVSTEVRTIDCRTCDGRGYTLPPEVDQ